MNTIHTLLISLQIVGSLAAIGACIISVYLLAQFFNDYTSLRVMVSNIYNAISPFFEGHMSDFQDESFRDEYSKKVEEYMSDKEDSYTGDTDDLTNRFSAAKKAFDESMEADD